MEASTNDLQDLKYLEQFYFSIWTGSLVRSAVDIEVFTKLADKSLTLQELADVSGIKLRRPQDYFDTLVSLKLLHRDAEGRYSNTSMADKFYNKNKIQSYIGGYIQLVGAPHSPFIRAPDSFVNPAPISQRKTFTQNEADFFALAMHGNSVGSLIQVPKLELWKKYNSFIDVGGSKGFLVHAIWKENQHLKGVACDLPEVAPEAEKYFAQVGCQDSENVKFQVLNFLTDDFPKTDVVIIAHTMINWPDEVKDLLIKKSWDAINPGGALIIIEVFIDDDREENTNGFLVSIAMICVTEGHSSTKKEIADKMEKQGFVNIEYSPITHNGSIIGYKPQ